MSCEEELTYRMADHMAMELDRAIYEDALAIQEAGIPEIPEMKVIKFTIE
jgi:hypothetical protein